MLKEKQLQIVKFYEGDIIDQDDPFLSDQKAYVTWNALLFSDTSTEIARSSENRRLNPAFLKDPERIIEITGILLSCMQKCDHDIHVHRVERMNDYQCFLKTGRFESFISTSTAGFLNTYQDKTGLVLMDILIPKDTLCIDFSTALDHYQKAEEKEILLPPYCSVDIQEKKLSVSLLNIRDRNGEKPQVYCDVKVGKYRKTPVEECTMRQELIDASIRYYEALNHHLHPDTNDESMYMQYKKYIQNRIKKRMNAYE